MAKQLHRESGGKEVAAQLGDAATLPCLDQIRLSPIGKCLQSAAPSPGLLQEGFPWDHRFSPMMALATGLCLHQAQNLPPSPAQPWAEPPVSGDRE